MKKRLFTKTLAFALAAVLLIGEAAPVYAMENTAYDSADAVAVTESDTSVSEAAVEEIAVPEKGDLPLAASQVGELSITPDEVITYEDFYGITYTIDTSRYEGQANLNPSVKVYWGFSADESEWIQTSETPCTPLNDGRYIVFVPYYGGDTLYYSMRLSVWDATARKAAAAFSRTRIAQYDYSNLKQECVITGIDARHTYTDFYFDNRLQVAPDKLSAEVKIKTESDPTWRKVNSNIAYSTTIDSYTEEEVYSNFRVHLEETLDAQEVYYASVTVRYRDDFEVYRVETKETGGFRPQAYDIGSGGYMENGIRFDVNQIVHAGIMDVVHVKAGILENANVSYFDVIGKAYDADGNLLYQKTDCFSPENRYADAFDFDNYSFVMPLNESVDHWGLSLDFDEESVELLYKSNYNPEEDVCVHTSNVAVDIQDVCLKVNTDFSVLALPKDYSDSIFTYEIRFRKQGDSDWTYSGPYEGVIFDSGEERLNVLLGERNFEANTTYEYQLCALMEAVKGDNTVEVNRTELSNGSFTTGEETELGTLEQLFPDERLRNTVKNLLTGYYPEIDGTTLLTDVMLNKITYLSIDDTPASTGKNIRLKSLEGITYLKNLKFINISYSNLNTLSRIDFSQLEKLEELYLDYNEITEMPDLTGCAALQIVSLVGNRLSAEQLATVPDKLPSQVGLHDAYFAKQRSGDAAYEFEKVYYRTSDGAVTLLVRISDLKYAIDKYSFTLKVGSNSYPLKYEDGLYRAIATDLAADTYEASIQASVPGMTRTTTVATTSLCIRDIEDYTSTRIQYVNTSAAGRSLCFPYYVSERDAVGKIQLLDARGRLFWQTRTKSYGMDAYELYETFSYVPFGACPDNLYGAYADISSYFLSCPATAGTVSVTYLGIDKDDEERKQIGSIQFVDAAVIDSVEIMSQYSMSGKTFYADVTAQGLDPEQLRFVLCNPTFGCFNEELRIVSYVPFGEGYRYELTKPSWIDTVEEIELRVLPVEGSGPIYTNMADGAKATLDMQYLSRSNIRYSDYNLLTDKVTVVLKESGSYDNVSVKFMDDAGKTAYATTNFQNGMATFRLYNKDGSLFRATLAGSLSFSKDGKEFADTYMNCHYDGEIPDSDFSTTDNTYEPEPGFYGIDNPIVTAETYAFEVITNNDATKEALKKENYSLKLFRGNTEVSLSAVESETFISPYEGNEYAGIAYEFSMQGITNINNYTLYVYYKGEQICKKDISVSKAPDIFVVEYPYYFEEDGKSYIGFDTNCYGKKDSYELQFTDPYGNMLKDVKTVKTEKNMNYVRIQIDGLGHEYEYVYMSIVNTNPDLSSAAAYGDTSGSEDSLLCLDLGYKLDLATHYNYIWGYGARRVGGSIEDCTYPVTLTVYQPYNPEPIFVTTIDRPQDEFDPYSAVLPYAARYYIDPTQLYTLVVSDAGGKSVKAEYAYLDTKDVTQPELTAEFSYISAMLGGEIALEIFVDMSEDTVDAKNKYIEYTLRGETYKLYDHVKRNMGNKDYYVYVIPVAGAYMGENISLSMVADGVVLDTANVSVAGYLKKILADDSYQSFHDIARATLNYGAYAQKYFGVNEANPVNSGIEDNVLQTVLKQEIVKDDTIREKLTATTFECTGASLTCLNKTSLKFYFTANNESANMTNYSYSISCGGTVLDADAYYVEQISDTIYALVIPDISAARLTDVFTVRVANRRHTLDYVLFSYSPMTYIQQAQNNSDANLKNLTKAMYLYGKSIATLLDENNSFTLDE